ncbi:RICIN domain-containing protein [Streptomyces sp. INA 01156]
MTYRRAGTELDPDLRAHLDGCVHCRHAADQLAGFTNGLGTALAEAVLGWSAREYVASRARAADATDEPAAGSTGGGTEERPSPEDVVHTAFPAPRAGPRTRRTSRSPARRRSRPFPPRSPRRPHRPPVPDTAPSPAAHPGPHPASRRRRAAPRTGSRGAVLRAGSRVARKAARRAARRRNLAAGILTVSGLIVLPLVLWTSGGSDAAARGDGRPFETPGAEEGTPSPGDASRPGSGEVVKGVLRGRLHNTASGLCVGVVGDRAVAGAETELIACSAGKVQQWTYETDGLLRNVAEPDLCLDSRLGYSVRLARCAGPARADADSARYDFTVQGSLVPRSGQDLGLAPAATDGSGALVLKTRDDSDAQRWAIHASEFDPRKKVVDRDAGGPRG